MARDTLAAGKLELYNAFQSESAPTIANVSYVFRWEPILSDLGGSGNYIAVSTIGIGPSVFRYMVRVYVSLSGSMELASDQMDQILLDADHAIPGTFGDSDWRIRHLDDVGLLRAEAQLECARED